jgi:hypothetical protein
MESRKIPEKIEGQKLGLLIFECVMAVLYLLLGIAFLFTSLFENVVSGWIRIALGGLLGVYGIFRIVRAVKKLA